MLDSITQLQDIKDKIKKSTLKGGLHAPKAELIAVSKTYEADAIEPLLQHGQRLFGENKVQEAQKKWPALRAQYPDIELHLIGPLQSNKVADAVAIFDCLHTIDREKIARMAADEMAKQQRFLPTFIQINTALEPQKAGIAPRELPDFLAFCQDQSLNIIGLMCIPPVGENPGPHFALLHQLAKKHGLSQLSMGMSHDYELALSFGATYIRVGSAIFGQRS